MEPILHPDPRSNRLIFPRANTEAQDAFSRAREGKTETTCPGCGGKALASPPTRRWRDGHVWTEQQTTCWAGCHEDYTGRNGWSWRGKAKRRRKRWHETIAEPVPCTYEEFCGESKSEDNMSKKESQSKYTAEQRAEAERLLREGREVVAIAAQMGVPWQMVATVKRNLDPPLVMDPATRTALEGAKKEKVRELKVKRESDDKFEAIANQAEELRQARIKIAELEDAVEQRSARVLEQADKLEATANQIRNLQEAMAEAQYAANGEITELKRQLLEALEMVSSLRAAGFSAEEEEPSEQQVETWLAWRWVLAYTHLATCYSESDMEDARAWLERNKPPESFDDFEATHTGTATLRRGAETAQDDPETHLHNGYSAYQAHPLTMLARIARADLELRQSCGDDVCFAAGHFVETLNRRLLEVANG